jgi:2-oxoglutarate ferredoxin oxidoreductase subunit beta
VNKKALKREKVVATPRAMLMPPPGCPGCQHPTIGRIIAEVLEELDIYGKAIGIMGIGCHAGIAMLNIDVVMGAHGRPPDMATAIKRLSPDTIVFTVQGDGDCIAIGADPFIGALTRGEKFSIIVCNNANYGTTGGQMAPTTLVGQITTTSSGGRDATVSGYPVHIPELATMFKGVAYSARGAVNTPANYQRTKRYIRAALQKQIDGVGLSFVEVLSACPPNWHLSPVESLKWVAEKMIPEFPLGEFKNVDRIE